MLFPYKITRLSSKFHPHQVYKKFYPFYSYLLNITSCQSRQKLLTLQIINKVFITSVKT